jgi:hypothetical protein
MYRILDVKKARNHRAFWMSKSVMSSKATLLAILVFSMFLPLAFSTQGQSSKSQPPVETGPVQAPAVPLPDNRIIYAENHQAPLTLEDHYAHIPFFTESESMSSTLTLNNNMPDSMRATVTVFNQKGDSVVVPPIALPPMNAVRFSLKDLTKDSKGDFSSGSVEVFYHGSSMAVTSQVSIISATKGIAFESTETAAMNFESNRLDAIAWLPDRDTQARVALTNTTDIPVNVTVSASQGQSKTSKSLRLEAREMHLVDLNELMESQSDTPSLAIVSLEHYGMHGAVIATGFVLNEQKGYSGNMFFIDRATAKTSRLAGAHVRFGAPNGKEGFPQGTRFSAPLVVANLSDEKTKAHVFVDYTIASVARRMDLGELSLESGALKQLELDKEMARRGVLLPVDDAGVDIEYTGRPGAVMGRLTSVDQTGEFVYDVPVKDPLGEMMRGNGCHPWRLDNGYTTVVHLKNTFNKKVYALVQVRYEGGTYNLERLPMAPFQSISVDIGELRNRQEKDIRDSVMPIDTQSGQVAWYEEEVGSLIGRAEVANVQAGIASSFSCGDTCICPPSFASTYVTPSAVAGAPGGSTTMAVYETRSNCTTTFGPFNRTSDSSWTSNNGSVASASTGGNVSFVGAGNCSVNAQFTALVYLPGCATMNVYPNPGSGLSVLQVAVKEVGFRNDHQLSRYVDGQTHIVVDSPDGTAPTWKSTGNPGHPVAYTKGAMPSVFATFGITPTAPAWVTAKIRVKNGSTVMAQTPTISISGAQVTVSPFNFTQALESTVKRTDAFFTWEISFNGGTTWNPLGLSGPHIMYWTYATPLSPTFTSFSSSGPGQDFVPLYDLALEKACGYVNGQSAIGTVLSLINIGVKNEIYYNPSQTLAVFTHPLEVYTQFYHCQCANFASLYRGMIRSIGINGQVNYYFGGLTSNQIRTYKWSSTGDTSVSLQMTENANDFAGANPHFAFHALVNANGTLYDPSYGVTRSSIPYTETAFNTTPLQSSTAFPSQPNLYSGWPCSH